MLRPMLMLVGLTLVTQAALAQNTPWKHESEASIVQVGGNTELQSYSGKQMTSYSLDSNVYTAKGRYLSTKSAGTETAKAWDTSLRYERLLSEQWSVFAQYGTESDIFAGYAQRDLIDLGAKYLFFNTDKSSLFTELGIRDRQSLNVGVSEKTQSSSGRVYLEYSTQLNNAVGTKVWAEYSPNFTDSEDWLFNIEPSLSVMMTQVFSLKISYLLKHHQKLLTANEQRQDTTLTTSLVAKF